MDLETKTLSTRQNPLRFGTSRLLHLTDWLSVWCWPATWTMTRYPWQTSTNKAKSTNNFPHLVGSSHLRRQADLCVPSIGQVRLNSLKKCVGVWCDAMFSLAQAADVEKNMAPQTAS